MAHITILGAGLTGLSTAYHLEQIGFFDYEIFEKEKTVGGLCRSVEKDGFTFDYTGHLLHINKAPLLDDYMYTFIKKVAGFDTFNQLNRKARIYSGGTRSGGTCSGGVLTHYPFQTNLYGLPSDIIVECIKEYVTRKKTAHPRSFYSWVCTHFGKGFGKHFFFPYQEKIFCYDVKKLMSSWTGRFVPQTSLEEMIEGALKPKDENIGYNASFYYPKYGGIQTLINKLQNQLIQPIQSEYEVTELDLAKKVITFKNGHKKPYNILINTIPLDTLLQSINDKSTTSFNKASGKLETTSVLNVNFGINKQNISDNHWIYVPEKSYPFYRIGFPHHFANYNAPKNCSSAYTECAYIGQKPKNLEKQVIQKSKNFLNINDKSIIKATIETPLPISLGQVF
jgi:protoporphyrinogen oxidase